MILRRQISTFYIASFRLRFSVIAGSKFAWKLCKYRSWEPRLTNWVLGNVQALDGDLLVDVGANFGWYACVLGAKFSESEIFAFEPESGACALLDRNITQNGLRNIRVFNMALGSASGSLKLYVSGTKNSGQHSPLHLAGTSHMVEVQVQPLDELIPHGRNVAFLKIDAEGSEYSVLMGASRVLERTRLVMLEFTPSWLRQMGVEPGLLLDLMTTAGFKIAFVSPRNELVVTQKAELLADASKDPYWQKDLIFFRDSLETTGGFL